MIKWPLQRLSGLQIGYEKGTLNHLVGNVHTVQMDCLNPNFNLSPDFRSRRIFQHIPKTYPKPSTNSLGKKSFHLGIWGCLGYAPGVCWGFLRIWPKIPPVSASSLAFRHGRARRQRWLAIARLGFCGLVTLAHCWGENKGGPLNEWKCGYSYVQLVATSCSSKHTVNWHQDIKYDQNVSINQTRKQLRSTDQKDLISIHASNRINVA